MSINMINLDTVADFTWGFGCHFFLETEDGNFIWSDPEYQGDNTIKQFNGDYKEWCSKSNIPFGRDKGSHTIRGYCGENVKFL